MASAPSTLHVLRCLILGFIVFTAPKRTSDSRSDRPYRGDRTDRTEGARGRGSYGGGRNLGRAPGQDSRERDGNSRGGRASGGSRGGYSGSSNTGRIFFIFVVFSRTIRRLSA